MDCVLYVVALGLIRLLQALPLNVVARIGRAGGALAYWLDVRHRQVALQNLTAAFQTTKAPGEIRTLAKEHFRRLGENYCAAVKTSCMAPAALQRHLTIRGVHTLREPARPTQSMVFAIGHFGNFELYARANLALPGFQFATTYRALRQPALDRLLKGLRERSGLLVFERRAEVQALRAAMARPNVAVGFLADQHAGRSGTMLPFFGRLCSTSTAPAVFALRYRLPLRVGICYRVGLAQWTIEVSDEIPTAEQGRRRSVEAIMLDVNRAFEAAIRRDPANWFWVHNRWKAASPKRLTRPTDLAQAEAGVSEVPEAPRAEPVARGRLPQGD